MAVCAALISFIGLRYYGVDKDLWEQLIVLGSVFVAAAIIVLVLSFVGIL